VAWGLYFFWDTVYITCTSTVSNHGHYAPGLTQQITLNYTVCSSPIQLTHTILHVTKFRISTDNKVGPIIMNKNMYI